MPRRKTIQPDPIETHTFTIDGEPYLVEVRGEGSQEIGRGQHKKNRYEKWRDKVLEWVAEQYLSPCGLKSITSENDILKSPSTFSRALQKTDLYPLSGDDSSVRKRLYPDILREICILSNAIEEKNRNTT
jgi:hypothetical protein